MNKLKVYFFAATVIAGVASACIYTVTRGIHFKGSPTVDFGDPPHREGLYEPVGDGTGIWRPGTTYLDDGGAEQSYIAEREHRVVRDLKALSAIDRLSERGEFRKALGSYRNLFAEGRGDVSFERERIEVLEEGLRLRDLVGLRAYFHHGVGPIWLQPFLKYDALMNLVSGAQRAGQLEHFALQFPKSTRAEPALMTSARDVLRGPSGNQSPDIVAGTRVLKLLLTRYPRTRFRASALGWLARSDYLQSNYASALRGYWAQLPLLRSEDRGRVFESMILCEEILNRPGRLAYSYCLALGIGRDPNDRGHYLSQLADLLGEFKPADAKEFWGCLKDSPAALGCYLDYRLNRTQVTPDLIDLSSRIPVQGSHSGHIEACLAEAAYRLHRFDLASRFANKVESLTRDDNDRALATYLQASIAQKAGHRKQATQLYERVVRLFHKSYVAAGARENLALLYEKSGRFSDALDTYYELGYSYDVAYLLDARMAPSQIEDYLTSHPRHVSRDAIRFSLGIRFLRKHEFAKAKATFRKVPNWKRRAYVAEIPDWVLRDEVPSSGCVDPLKTTVILEHLYTQARKARGTRDKARALLAIGNYYYDHRNLLLYNPRLWHGERTISIGFSWNLSAASPADDEALRTHHEEHECLSQAFSVFSDLVKRYPKSSSAQRAEYRAACAAWRLSNFAPYWRWVADTGNLRLRAVNLMSAAAKGHDKSLAKAAAKFAKVYLDNASERSGEYANGVPPRRWNPTY